MKHYYPVNKLSMFVVLACACLFNKRQLFILTLHPVKKLCKPYLPKLLYSHTYGHTAAIIGFISLLAQNLLAQTPPAGFSSISQVSGLNQAVGLTFSKDGSRMFVWEKGGKVWVIRSGVKKLLIDIGPEVGNWSDYGMLGFALHPNFDVNGYFYLLYVVDRHHLLYAGTSSYSATANTYQQATIGRLTRYTATKNTSSDYSVSSATRKVLIGASKTTGIPILSFTHGVGTLLFGTDGTLLVSCGDGAHPGSSLDTGNMPESYYRQALADGIIPAAQNVGSYRSQQLESLNGKILRIDPLTGNGLPSNPFYQSTNAGSVRSRVWALGFRNPFRMSLKPASGSTNPADGRPGVLVVGDVGMSQWEEMNVVSGKGLNFGWPEFEGLQAHTGINGYPSYTSKNVENPYAPNPLYGVNGCTRRYFRFNELLKQESQTSPTFRNPCNTSQTVPSSIRTFVHTRPVIDWKHGTGPSRTGIFLNGQAAVVNIGASGSPVSGPQFGGNSSTGGLWYNGNDFPATYKNTYFHGDYSSGWIRNVVMNTYNKPTAVRNFINTGATVVCMATHPVSGGLYYVHYGAEVRRIQYGVNKPPVAVATVNKTYGVSPLAVQFTGSNSYDPEGSALTYEWNFGDNTSLSRSANPTHTYNAASGVPTKYTATLKVKDLNGAITTSTAIVISVNNTPPAVTITSPANNSLYSVTSATTYNLNASVTDKEHRGTGLSYQWQTVLHHESHTHPEPIDTKPATTVTLAPEGCNGETFYYRITLTVTDAAGLSGSNSVTLYPNCNTTTACAGTGGITRQRWNNVTGTSVATIPVNATPSSSAQLTLFETPSNTGDSYGQRVRGYVCPPQSGNYVFYIASDDNSELWLSTDDNPANKRRIAYNNSGWTNPREWTKFPTQTSAAIALQAGRRYYIEALHKENVGGDNLAVGWKLPSGTLERPIAGSRLIPFNQSTVTTGKISRQMWANATGTAVSTIPLTAAPTSTSEITILETPSNIGDSYGQRIRGYVHPPASGTYTFWIASDDNSELWLSTNDSPANKRRIAYNNSGWTNSREWTKFPTQQSVGISLTAGQKYYIEVLHKENVGGDNLAVGWKLPNNTLERPIPGSRLSPYSGSATRTSAETELAENWEGENSFIKVYPNPFSSRTTLEFTLPEEEPVTVSIFNAGGELVQELYKGTCKLGTTYTFDFEGNHLSNGLYMARVMTTRAVYYKKIILLK